MSIAPFLKTIGRGKDGARPLNRDQARDLMQRILNGVVSDLELGGFALAMRIKGETADELAGFMDAAAEHTLPSLANNPVVDTTGGAVAGALGGANRGETDGVTNGSASSPLTGAHPVPILLPSYNGARKLPNFTPLLAALLARAGAPVLVHGLMSDPGRVTSADVFAAMGQAAVGSAEALAARWDMGQPAFMALDVLNLPLASLLAVRRVLGLRNSGHTMAKLLPAVPGSLRVVNHTHPEYAISLSQYLRESSADAMLMRGTEGEPVADCRRQPRADVYLAGAVDPALSLAAQDGVLVDLPELPAAIDAASTAAHTLAILAGDIPVPSPIQRQVDTLMRARQRMLAR